jgi:AcrR family transcriptional regulator
VPKVTEAHRAERQQQILDGARRAFGRYGYGGATVPRLEEETGLSRGAIFSYFPSKLDLFLACAEQDRARILDLWIAEGFAAVIREVVGNPDWIGVYLEVPRMLRSDEELRARWHALNPERQQRLVEHYSRLQAEGEVRTDVDFNAIGNFLGALLDGISVHLGAGFPVDVDDTVELVRSALAPK